MNKLSRTYWHKRNIRQQAVSRLLCRNSFTEQLWCQLLTFTSNKMETLKEKKNTQ